MSLEMRVKQVIHAVRNMGIHSSEPMVLADGGNLIVHLAPHPMVARVMTLFGEDDAEYWKDVLAREIDVARHLENVGVPVVPPVRELDPGPHPAGNTWFTLWEFIPTCDLPTLTGEEAFELLHCLESGMHTYTGYLPPLTAWTPVCDAVRKLATNGNNQIQALVEYWTVIDKRLRDLPRDQLVPAHGDAHLGNLVASPRGVALA
jgi:hypothetical protein